ncbi:hypothetical protein BJ165DRAFT_1409661 [Panaeolus papilionaceus]|nr:hypothetical protein BJ165DRAFT_1409661 [Panaeolus papilionaceus]
MNLALAYIATTYPHLSFPDTPKPPIRIHGCLYFTLLGDGDDARMTDTMERRFRPATVMLENHTTRYTKAWTTKAEENIENGGARRLGAIRTITGANWDENRRRRRLNTKANEGGYVERLGDETK